MRVQAAAILAAAVTAFACSSDSRSTSTPSPAAPTPRPVYTGTLSGTVRDNTGTPIASVSVYVGVDPRLGGTGGAQTDVQGQYAITGLRAGSQQVSVSKPGYIRVSDAVVIGVQLVKDFALGSGVILGGRTTELGLLPLSGATISVISGPNAGTETTSYAAGVGGGWTLPPILPGDVTLRASRAGYDSIDRAVHALVDNYGIDFALRSSYGSCLTSVDPVLVNQLPFAGQTITVNVGANANRTWSASTNDSWIDVSTATRTGPGALSLRVLPYPLGATATRGGTVRIGCSATEGQTVYVNQLPECPTTIRWATDSPQVFPPEGGIGHILVDNGVAGCQSVEMSESDWIFLTGVSSWIAGEKWIGVRANTTGAFRTGSIIIGETRWTITQRP